MDRTFSTPEPVSLHVEIGSGYVQVEAREALDETRVTVDGEDAEDVTLEQRGNQILVLAPHRRGGFFTIGSSDLHVTATVPRDSELSTKLGSADLVVSGRVGSARLRSGSGDVNVEELGADAVVETGSADIRVGAAGGDLRVKSGSGDVEIRHLSQSAQISTGSGDVLLGTSEHQAVVKSGSGDVRVNDAHTDLSVTTASGDLAVDLIRAGAVRAKAVSGDVTVGVPAGIPVWTDISCVTGRVTSALEGAGEPDEGQDYIEVRATTVSGDIRLEQR